MKTSATSSSRLTAFLALVSASLLLAACESDQGMTPNVTQPATQTGGMKEIQPAPESQSFANKKDVFQGAEYDSGAGPLPAGAKQIRLRVGEVVEVFRGSFAVGDGQYEKAFYLPAEARSIAQLVVEIDRLKFTRTYFIKAIGLGDTVGGVVERRWLNSDGYDPKDAASEGRIQAAVRAAPVLISINN